MSPSPTNGNVTISTTERSLPDLVTERHTSSIPHTNGYLSGDKGDLPIAIIGYSLRFPQDATSAEAFWQMLVEGRSARTKIPSDRYKVDAFHHPDRTRHDSMNVNEAHFLEGNIAAFDAPFFSINPTEAASMDPQQRGLLETAYRAFENAGIPLEEAAGSKTSVHIGSFTHDWKDMLRRDPLLDISYEATGTEFSILANRLSWFYDLNGPSVSLDTACSSSLMALHLACQSLKLGEADMGLVGGANLLLDPMETISMVRMGMLSPDGISYSFDDRANGYARGEGFAVVLVKRLEDALKHGDAIRGIIRATGSNQDGKTPGISQPSGTAQEKLIRQTYKAAGLDMGPVRYFEAHGTGTQVGDPTEAKSVASAFKGSRPSGDPLYVGSVKPNIGHLEGASGLASLIKTILILEKALIPPNIWFEKVNPRIQEHEWNIKIPVKPTPWPAKGLRRASVNSFGFGGSNVHVVLDDVFNYLDLHASGANRCLSPSAINTLGSRRMPERRNTLAGKDPESSELLFIWSAADEDALKRVVKHHAAHLSRLRTLPEPQQYLRDLAYTLSARRSLLRWRSCVVADSFPKLLQAIENNLPQAIRPKHTCRVGFVFTGQGAQWHAMGRELLEVPLYQESLSASQKILGELGCTWSVFDELGKTKEATNVDNPAYSQPLCTVVQMALVDLLYSLNIRPTAVVGHSSGEIAAAYSVGALSRESALKVAFYRGHVSATLANSGSRPGAMVSVNLSEKEVQLFLDRTVAPNACNEISVACVNSPFNVTLSGDAHQITTLISLFEQQNVFARKLAVNVAYHSKSMEQIALKYKTLIGHITMGGMESHGATMFSSVIGAKISNTEVCQPGYWVKNLTSQVRFLEAFSNLCLQSTQSPAPKVENHGKGIAVTDVLEIGPHSALQRPIKDTLNSLEHRGYIVYSSILQRNVSALTSLFTAAGRLHCQGHPVNVTSLNDRGQKVSRTVLSDLPEYPFNKLQSYSVEGRLSKNFRSRTHPRHELLGTTDPNWNAREARWRHVIRATDNPWILDHKVNGVELYPAAGMLVMAIEAARQVANTSGSITGYRLSDVSFPKALMSIPRANDFETNIFLRPLDTSENRASGSSEFRVYTLMNGEWDENCRGTITVEYKEEQNEVDAGREATMELQYFKEAYAATARSCCTPIEPAMLYEILEGQGLSYGDTFQTLDEVHYSDHEAVGQIKLGKWATMVNEMEYQDHVIHPTALDGLLQLCYVTAFGKDQSKAPTMVPERIDQVWISAHGGLRETKDNNSITAYARRSSQDSRGMCGDITALDNITYEPQVLVKNLRLTLVDSQLTSLSSSSTPAVKRLCYSVSWRPDIDLLSPQDLLSLCGDSTAADPLREKFIEDVELICYRFITDALKRIDDGEITGMKPQFDRYIQWMRRQNHRYSQGEMIHWQSTWPDRRCDDAYTQDLMSGIETFSPEGRLYTELGRNLAGILDGRIDALDLLFSGDLAADYYKETIKSLGKIEPYVEALAHKNPGLRVLEIGAGTGSATTFFLEVLSRHRKGAKRVTPRYASYTFTDISPQFFEKAKQTYSVHTERMVYSTLDIERDPVQQGFSEKDYDLVIAVNVLHATSDLTETLRNVRKLLRPGGKLILYEFHNDVVSRAGFAFGLLPGWWRSTEAARQWDPTVSENDWHTYLCANGFSGTDMACWDYASVRTRMGLIIISTALEPLISQSAFPGVTIITSSGESGSQGLIGTRIETELSASTYSDIPCEVVSVSHLATETIEQRFCIFLPEVDASYLRDMNEDQYTRLQSLFRCAKAVLWITRGGGESPTKPELDMILGLSRVYHSESTTAKIITLSLPGAAAPETVAQHAIRILLDRLRNNSPESSETEYEVRDGLLSISRVVEADYLNDYLHSKLTSQRRNEEVFGKEERALALSVRSPGLLDTIKYVEDFGFQQPLAPDEVEVKVKAVGVNFKDVLLASGRRLDQDDGNLGNECAGVVVRAGPNATLMPGDRVCVCAPGTFKTYVRSKSSLVFKIPDTLSFCEAASFPIAFTTAYHALCGTARLSSGDSILIHSAAGGTGQAAIQIARLLDAEIYATVGLNEKKKLIMDLYDIPEDHIFSSRELSFVKGIKRMTKGRGVDVVLNSLADEGLQGSWDCLAAFGRFVEIGTKDIIARKKLPMMPFIENRTFAAVNLTHMMSERPDLIRKTMEAILALVGDGKIQAPQPLHIYSNSRIEEAFRHLQSGRNTGKTIVEFKDDDVVQVVSSPRSTCSFRADRTYLIAGGLGGLGRRIARWMIERGAKYLLLLSRSGASSPIAKEFVAEFYDDDDDVRIETPSCDVSDEQALAATLKKYATTMPPVQGCIQASMVLSDSDFQTMSLPAFTAAINPKVHGSWNLHAHLPQNLDFFVLLSSVSGVAGYIGQANYAAGNTYQDALARHRISTKKNGHGQRQKAVSLDLGVIENVGYVAERLPPEMRTALKTHGILPCGENELLALLEYYCDENLGILTPATCQVVTGLEIPSSMAAQGLEDAYWMGKSLFRTLHQYGSKNPAATITSTSPSSSDDKEEKLNIPSLLASTPAIAASLLTTLLSTKLSRTLSMPLENIDPAKPMHAFGVDSLVALEMRNWFIKEVEVDITVFELLGNESITELSGEAVRRRLLELS